MAKSIYTAEQEVLQALLKELRLAVGIRQAELAVKLGRPQSYVSKYEGGERRLDVLELRQVCQALGTDLPAFARRLEKRLGKLG